MQQFKLFSTHPERLINEFRCSHNNLDRSKIGHIEGKGFGFLFWSDSVIDSCLLCWAQWIKISTAKMKKLLCAIKINTRPLEVKQGQVNRIYMLRRWICGYFFLSLLFSCSQVFMKKSSNDTFFHSKRGEKIIIWGLKNNIKIEAGASELVENPLKFKTH